MTGKNSIDWLQEKISLLVEASKKLVQISDTHYPGHTWSVVKLLLLGGWSYVYTTIISNYIDKYWKEYWYVDLLSGPGTSIVKERDVVVAGSPFVAHFFAKREYSRYVFIEMKEEYYRALLTRSKAILGDKADVLKGDCNEIAPREADKAGRRKAHFLAFVDNEGLDARWPTIERLLKAECDVIINFPTSGIRRVFGAAHRDDINGHRSAEALTEFYGGEDWRDASNEEMLLRIYMEKIGTTYYKMKKKEPYVSPIRVGDEHFYYDIILVTKRGPYTGAWDYLRSRLEDMRKNIDLVAYTLDFLTGKAKRIDWFISLQKRVEEAGKKEPNRKDAYGPLDRWLWGEASPVDEGAEASKPP